ncbi:putative kinase [Carpediemonas membranifera]|uniref:Putative kinase n=1 Tax=Carpediemonas membranifera TaxID=201153 RepID=A0A8J6E2Q6_9EUKA|nr:putative kinase [Carpediemonas membranifera]|eukprot:KAG9394973.1 putative kinase [Carpediemonas membranifera]
MMESMGAHADSHQVLTHMPLLGLPCSGLTDRLQYPRHCLRLSFPEGHGPLDIEMNHKHKLVPNVAMSRQSLFPIDVDMSIAQTPHHGGQALFLLDLDDTLIATTFLLNELEAGGLSSTAKKQLKGLDKTSALLVRELLSAAHTKVAVVTCGTASWMTAALTYFPRLRRALRRTLVVSARDTWADAFPVEQYGHNASCMWKLASFRRIVSSLDDAASLDVISIGDSPTERRAARYLLKSAKKDKKRRSLGQDAGTELFVKSVQTAAAPSPEVLSGQLNQVMAMLDVLRMPRVSMDGTIDEIGHFAGHGDGGCGLDPE